MANENKQHFKLVRKTGREPYKRPPGLSAIQRRTGNPRPTKSRPRVKRSGFNFARGSESPFVHCTQPYRRAGNPPSSGTREHSSRYHGFACQPLRGLVTSRNGEISKKTMGVIIRCAVFPSKIQNLINISAYCIRKKQLKKILKKG